VIAVPARVGIKPTAGTAPEAQSRPQGKRRVSTCVGRGAIMFAPTATAIGTARLPPMNGHSASLSVDGE